jgi:hypothetical protein
MVLPTAELIAADPSGRFYVSFLAALDDHPELMPVLDVFDASTERYLCVLARATPGMSEPDRVLRFAVAKYLAYRLLGQPDGPIQTWVARHGVARTAAWSWIYRGSCGGADDTGDRRRGPRVGLRPRPAVRR